MLHIHRFVTGPFAENCYFITCPTTRQFAVVDAGDGIGPAIEAWQAAGFTCSHLLQTHCHLDHVMGLAAAKRLTGAPIVMHEAEVPVLDHFQLGCSMFGIRDADPPPPAEPEHFVADGGTVQLGDTTLTALLVPGHTPGHIAFYWGPATITVDSDGNVAAQPGAAPTTPTGADVTMPTDGKRLGAVEIEPGEGGHNCLVGDVIFRGSIGRVDLPGGHGPSLIKSIRERLFKLPPETLLLPGHESTTTIARERAHNPFVGDNARLRLADLG